MTNKETPGQRLRRLRKAKGLTQSELAEAVGLGTKLGVFSNYERGENSPPAEALDALAKFFDVDLDYLRCLTDKPREKPPATFAPDVLLFAERVNALPNGLRGAVIGVSEKIMDDLSAIYAEEQRKIADLRKRLVASRGEEGASQWERERNITLLSD